MKDLKWILKKLDIIMNNFFSRFPIFNKKKKKKKTYIFLYPKKTSANWALTFSSYKTKNKKY